MNIDPVRVMNLMEVGCCRFGYFRMFGSPKDSNGGEVIAEADSQFGYISYRDTLNNIHHCDWCYEKSGNYSQFAPRVYGVGRIKTDAGNTIEGTSFACPQVAAAAAIDLSVQGINSYISTADRFTQMHTYKVVNNDESLDAAKLGDLLDAAQVDNN